MELAQLVYAVEHEMAQSLADVMFVSTYWGYERKWTRETLLPFAEEMARRLAWDDARIKKEISALVM
jgi:glycerol-3-phosphate dehydrogenase